MVRVQVKCILQGQAPKVSQNDGASCRGAFVTPEICGNGIDDDNNGDIDCGDMGCMLPVISNVNITSPSNCPALDNATIEIIASGTDLELSLIHISEPTRRYAISYAVFCLKKKK